MLELIFLFTFRVFSGWQNGFGYAKDMRGRVFIGTLMAAMLAYLMWAWYQADMPGFFKWVAIGGATLSFLALLGVEDSFNDKINVVPKDIHLYETILTGGITIAWIFAGGNIFLIAAHVMPAMILHKGLINVYGGLKFFDTRTDDPTGRYYSIPSLKKVLDALFPNRAWLKEGKIRRSSNQWRIFWALVSLGFIYMALRYGWTLSINPFKLEL